MEICCLLFHLYEKTCAVCSGLGKRVLIVDFVFAKRYLVKVIVRRSENYAVPVKTVSEICLVVELFYSMEMLERMSTQDLITQFGWEEWEHPPYSPPWRRVNIIRFCIRSNLYSRPPLWRWDDVKNAGRQWLSSHVGIILWRV